MYCTFIVNCFTTDNNSFYKGINMFVSNVRNGNENG